MLMLTPIQFDDVMFKPKYIIQVLTYNVGTSTSSAHALSCEPRSIVSGAVSGLYHAWLHSTSNRAACIAYVYVKCCVMERNYLVRMYNQVGLHVHVLLLDFVGLH